MLVECGGGLGVAACGVVCYVWLLVCGCVVVSVWYVVCSVWCVVCLGSPSVCLLTCFCGWWVSWLRGVSRGALFSSSRRIGVCSPYPAREGQAFGKLREMLSKTKSADLRGLNFRLDFSEFYADLPAQPEDDLEQL